VTLDIDLMGNCIGFKTERECTGLVSLLYHLPPGSDEGYPLPRFGTKNSAGFDIACPKDSLVKAWETVRIPTDLQFCIPNGMYLRVTIRTSMAMKGLSVPADVVDSDYRGRISIIIRNHTNEAIVIKRGEYVVQGILQRCYGTCLIRSEKEFSILTQRGTGGFGSTNV